MSFVQLDGIGDVKEPTIAPDGSYELVITDAEAYQSEKNGRTIVKCRIEFEGHDDYASFMHFLALPSRDLDIDGHQEGPEAGQRKYDMMMLSTRRFLELWGIPYEGGFAVEDFHGARCKGKVTSETDDEGRTFQRLVVPRIQE